MAETPQQRAKRLEQEKEAAQAWGRRAADEMLFDTVTRLDHAVFGLQGNNGLMATMRQIKEQQEKVADDLAKYNQSTEHKLQEYNQALDKRISKGLVAVISIAIGFPLSCALVAATLIFQ